MMIGAVVFATIAIKDIRELVTDITEYYKKQTIGWSMDWEIKDARSKILGNSLLIVFFLLCFILGFYNFFLI